MNRNDTLRIKNKTTRKTTTETTTKTTTISKIGIKIDSKINNVINKIKVDHINKIDKLNKIDDPKLDDLMEMIKCDNKIFFSTLLSILAKQSLFNANAQNEYGNTLMHVACRSRNYEVVKFLLNEFNAKTDIKNVDGRTPLHIATIYGSTDKTCYMFQDKFTNKRIINSINIINILVDKAPYILHVKDNDGMTPMNYFTIHSDTSPNSVFGAKYKNYKRIATFFDRIKNSDVNNNDYELTMSIYFAMKRNQQ